ncbi:MAG: SEC-C metal-binding domain-containing protein [Betaproteobacteria bacterium]
MNGMNVVSSTQTPLLPDHAAGELARLDVNGLLGLLVADEDRAPRALIDECARRGEAMVEALYGVVDEGRAWKEDGEPGDWWLMLHAGMILGRITSESGGLQLVKLMRRMAAEEDDNLQDWFAGDWPALFANKPPRVVDAARELADDRALDWYIRCQAVEVVVGGALREGADALEQALDWVAERVADESEDRDMRASAASTLLDFCRERYRALLNSLADEEMRLAAKEGPFGIPRFTPEEVEGAFAKGRDEPAWQRRSEPWRFYSPEAIAQRQERWAKEDAEDSDEDESDDVPAPYVREAPRIGRNEPCPCGSGKKYKKCCLLKEGV